MTSYIYIANLNDHSYIYIYMDESQEKCPIQNFTLFTSYVSVIINLNAICRYFIFLQLRNIQIRVVILKLAF